MQSWQQTATAGRPYVLNAGYEETMPDDLKHTTIPLDRAWNTWSGERPAEMVFLPLGVRVTPLAYAASTRKATFFQPGPDLALGPRELDGSRIDLGFRHAGTSLDFTYEKDGPFDLVGQWRTLKLGEWGLRFWLVIALSSEDGTSWTYDPDTGTLSAAFGFRHVAVKSGEPPLMVSAHDSLAAIAAEYEQHGYWHLASRATTGKVMALRYHLEEMPQQRFAVAIRDDAVAARERAAELAAAASPAKRAAPAKAPSDAQQALDAIRDVMAWNTVFDRINRRAYISLSRNWNQEKFGGFGVWLNDQQYCTYLVGMLDSEAAHESQLAVLSGQTPDGNLPCLLTAKDAWVDRTQLPIGSFLAWLGYLRDGSRPALEVAYSPLLRNHDWWWRRRDGNNSGLVAFGNSPVGTGLYRGTNIGARDESSMDNSPMHDEARFDKKANTLNQWDVGLNSMLCLDAEMLALIARELGDGETAARLEGEASGHRDRISRELWDDSRGIFANRLWTGKFARSVSPTSFWPLLCGAATPQQAKGLLAHLQNETSFGGTWMMPSVQRSDPAYPDNVYWRGRVWPPLNWTVWQGLRRYGFDAEASHLSARSWALFRKAWDPARLCPENFNADTGEALDQPDTDGFYSWGALMPALALSEVMHVSAWHGWEVCNAGKDLTLGPVITPIGRARLEIEAGRLRLSDGLGPVLETDARGRLSHLSIERNAVSLELPAGLKAGAVLRLPRVDAGRVVLARQGTADLKPQSAKGPLAFTLRATGAARERVFVLVRDGG